MADVVGMTMIIIKATATITTVVEVIMAVVREKATEAKITMEKVVLHLVMVAVISPQLPLARKAKY